MMLFSEQVTDIVMSSYLRDVLIKTSYQGSQLFLLRPCSVKADVTYSLVSRDNQHFLSQCLATVATGMVSLDLGQEHVLCLQLISQHVSQFLKVILLL